MILQFFAIPLSSPIIFIVAILLVGVFAVIKNNLNFIFQYKIK